ncbi:PCSK5 [Symbiodinium sp. CCMP2592]|nr:PCSK5 [Symbiodinium sp. CCMP2592]
MAQELSFQLESPRTDYHRSFDDSFHLQSRMMFWTKPLVVWLLLLEGSESQPQATDFVQEVYLVQSIGLSIPLFWRAGRAEYSLALPRDSQLVALRVDLTPPSSSEGAALLNAAPPLAVRVPSRGLRFLLSPGVTSAYVFADIGETLDMRIELLGREYGLRVLRSKITSSGLGLSPDPARLYPPQGTLAGLNLWDSMGLAANMAWFAPRVSLYFASIRENAHGVRLAATPNDPDAELEWRMNGGKWDFLVSGLTSSPAEVATFGWTLLEVRVSSSSLPESLSPLVYQVVLARGARVCHPSCAYCSGPSATDCESCVPPLILADGKCLYTACPSSTQYFNTSTERCEPCDSSCLECADGSPWGCISCPPSRYLRPSSEIAIVGSCDLSCLYGFFVQPTSQRCQIAPAGTEVERFYLRLTLRISLEDFLDSSDTLKEVLFKSAETLAVSPQDVRFHKWESAKGGLGVFFFLEVENPFVQHDEPEEWFSIDDWFASLPVPVDEIRIMTQSQLYPPGPQPAPTPFLDPWLLGAIGAASASLLLLYPLYTFYFVRKYKGQMPYYPGDGQEQFVDYVLEKTDPAVMSAMVNTAGNLKAAATEE